SDPNFMQSYWDQTRLLFQRIAMFGKPAVVHVEPDFWGYAEQKAHGTPSALPVKVSASECSSLPQDVSGMAACIFTLARMYAPKASFGLHASVWGAPAAADVAAWMKAVGADQGDFLATDLLDRDAGCFEAHTDPNCMRGGTTGWYWDETNATNPNFHEF